MSANRHRILLVAFIAGCVVATGAVSGVTVAASGVDDPYEPNDNFDEAAAVSEGQYDLAIENGESDFFELTANRTDALDVRLTPNSADLEFRVYDQNRQEVVGDGFVPSGTTGRLTAKLPANGTYYVEVTGNDADTTSNYTLDIEVVTPSENDAYAPNGGFETSAQLSEGFTEAKLWGGESDFFEVTANRTDALDLRLTPANGDAEFRIYDQSRQELVGDGFVPSGNTGRLTAKLPENGTYYVEVTGNDRFTTTNYTLEADVVTPTENDAYAPNDGFESTARLSEGFTEAKLWGGESDFFEVTANRTDALDVRLTPNSADLEFRVYDQNRQEVVGDGFVPSGTTGRLTAKLPENGTYYVEVTGNDAFATTNYTLQTDVVRPSENDAYAPNDGFESTARLSEGFTEAKLWGGESDFFEVTANRTDALDVRLTPNSADLEFRVYDQNRQELVGDGFVPSGTTSRLTKKLPENGTYYVEVTGNDAFATTNYTLQTDVVRPSENDAYAPNDGFESAAFLTEEFTDAKIWGGESDFYRVRLNASDGYSIALSPDADMEISVYGPDRTELASDGFVPGGNRQELTVSAETAGTYYVEVRGDDATTTAEYTLQTNRTSEPLSPLEVTLSTANVTAGSGENVTVTVTDAGTGDPVEGANVSVPGLGVSATTNASGEAALSGGLQAGTYSVTATADGYAEATATLTVESTGPDVPGVSSEVASAVAGEDGTVDRQDILAMVQGYLTGGSVDGVSVTRNDVLALVQYYLLN